jgi:hypothetical protein
MDQNLVRARSYVSGTIIGFSKFASKVREEFVASPMFERLPQGESEAAPPAPVATLPLPLLLPLAPPALTSKLLLLLGLPMPPLVPVPLPRFPPGLGLEPP